MGKEFRRGDRVRWDAGNQSSVAEEPQYLVRSEKSGKTAVHHPDKLHEA